MVNGAAKYAEVQQVPAARLVEQYTPLVTRIGHHLLGRLPASVQLEDLIQAGMIGLLEAARNYSSAKGASFETFAGIRIRGAMIDEIRKGDWTPRSVHRSARRSAEVVRELEHRTGRDAESSEVAAELGIALDEYNKVLQDANSCQILAFDDVGGREESFIDSVRSDDASPHDAIQQVGFQHSLADAIKSLPEREQLVLALYYDEELNLREIGQVIDVSESRVSQIHGQAMLRLRSRLNAWVAD